MSNTQPQHTAIADLAVDTAIQKAAAKHGLDAANLEHGLAETIWTLIPANDLAAARETRETDGTTAAVDQALGKGVVTHERILRAFETSSEHGIKALTRSHPAYPAILDDLGNRRPEALWYIGDADLLGRPESIITLSGSRASSGYGELVTANFASRLVERGYVIAASGAYGIAGSAHRVAMAAGGKTIAVLAGGLDRLYPAGNSELLRRVAETGLLLSEAPAGANPTRWAFHERSRILGAIGAAVIVTEAGARSGAVTMAAEAADLGRFIGAVPGPVTSGGSAGCHLLMRDHSAAVIQQPQDIVALLEREA